MDSNNLAELDKIEPVTECCNGPVSDECQSPRAINPCDCESNLPVTDIVTPEQLEAIKKQEQAALQPGDPNDPRTAGFTPEALGMPSEPQQVMLEFGFSQETKQYSMLITFPNAGNTRINFNLDEMRGVRNNIIHILDLTTQQA